MFNKNFIKIKNNNDYLNCQNKYAESDLISDECDNKYTISEAAENENNNLKTKNKILSEHLKN